MSWSILPVVEVDIVGEDVLEDDVAWVDEEEERLPVADFLTQINLPSTKPPAPLVLSA